MSRGKDRRLMTVVRTLTKDDWERHCDRSTCIALVRLRSDRANPHDEQIGLGGLLMFVFL